MTPRRSLRQQEKSQKSPEIESMTPRRSLRQQEEATPVSGNMATPGSGTLAAPGSDGALPGSITMTPRKSLRLLEKATPGSLAVAASGTDDEVPPGSGYIAPPVSAVGTPTENNGVDNPESNVGTPVHIPENDVQVPLGNVDTASLPRVAPSKRRDGPGAMRRTIKRSRGRPRGRQLPLFGPKRARGRPLGRRVVPLAQPSEPQKSAFQRTIEFLKTVLPLVIPILLPIPFFFK